jgi:hypothetical protein
MEARHCCFAKHNHSDKSQPAVDVDSGDEKRLLPLEAVNLFGRQVSEPAEPKLHVKNTFLTWGLPAEFHCPRRSKSAPPQMSTGPLRQAGCNVSDGMCNSGPLDAVPTVTMHPMDMMRAKPESPPQGVVVSPWGAFRRSSPPPRARRPSMGGVAKLM